MKTFRSIVQEAAKPKSRVLLFGRMNPITKGHEENVNAAHAIAQKHGADLHVIASHSHDVKKNPLSPEQKATHLKRAFGHLSNTHVGTSSKEAPTILHQAAQAHAAGVKHLVIAGGGDRAAGYHKLLHDYNGVQGKSHGYYKFDKISIENTGERKEGVSGTDMRKHAAAGHFDKFRAGLPSKIAGNEKHAQEMYHHVRQGMGVHEETREDYVTGDRLRLGESVVDTFTGMQGRIVYRGPTYVTVQIDETTSFKRWIDDVDVVEDAQATFANSNKSNLPSFKDHIKTPADIKKYWLDSLHYCPGAQKAFEPMIGNTNYDQGIVQEAIDATAHYLNIEETAAKTQHLDDHAITAFNSEVRHASQLLSQLGALHEHKEYIEKHIHDMMAMANKLGVSNLGEAKSIDLQGHQDISDDDLKEIERHIDSLEEKDLEKIYAETQKDEADAEMDPVDESLNAAQRMKKKIDFLKTKSKREMSATMARHRASTPGRLKRRSITAARTLIMQRLLRGRDKSQLSSAEKNRIESIVHKSKAAVVRISNRLMPKLRQLEMKRLRRVHEANQATDLNYDAEQHAVDTVAANDTDTTGNPLLQHVKDHLSGIRPTTVSDPEHAKKSISRLKNFRKME
jgi:hypothetical protein